MEKTNFIIIFMDDMGYGDIGLLWDKIYQNTSQGLDRRKWSQIYRSLFCRTHLYTIPLRFAHRTLPTACWSTPSSISKR